MLKTNKNKLVCQSIQGQIDHPRGGSYRISHDGTPMILPATGAICYNVNIGDSAFGLAGDHIEPGVSIYNPNKVESDALMKLSCIGNKAVVISGNANAYSSSKNYYEGYVTGTHGGIEHVLIHFDSKEQLLKMSIGDKILIRSYGQGLRLIDYPDIKVMNIDPDLFESIEIKETDGKISVPVVCKIPAHFMGSGIGAFSSSTGDYDIMTADLEEIKKYGIDKLKFGDLVLLEDCDNTYGRGYLKGAVSIGVIVHSDCIKMGHGPGVTTILTCKKSLIEGFIDPKSNITKYYKKSDKLNKEF